MAELKRAQETQAEKGATYIIETRRDRYNNWECDTIGANPPRSERECRADVAAFAAGECGPEMATGFRAADEGIRWRIIAT